MQFLTPALLVIAGIQIGCSAPQLREVTRINCADVVDLAFTADGERLVVAAYPDSLTDYDVLTGNVVKSFTLSAQPIDMSAGRARRSFAVALINGKVDVIYEIEGQRVPFQQADEPTAVAMHHNSQTIAVAYGKELAEANRIVLKHSATDSPAVVVGTDAGLVSALEFSKDGMHLYASSSLLRPDAASITHQIMRIDLGPSQQVSFDLNERHAGVDFGATTDATVVHLACTDGHIRVVDTRTQQVLRTYGAGDDPCWSFALSDDGKRAATGHGSMLGLIPAETAPTPIRQNCMTFVYDVETGKVIGRAKHDHPVRALAFSSDGRRLAAASDVSVRVYELPP